MTILDKIKIGYFADGIWGLKSLEKALDHQNIEVCFVVLRYNSQDKLIKDLALENNIDILVDKNVNSEDFIAKIQKYECDLFVSMSFNQIIRKKLFELTDLGFINCHAGALPFYRGRNILNWVIINGEKEFGITVHYINDGIDTGDIILQRKYPLTMDDNYATILDKAHKYCPEILIDAIDMVRTNNVKIIKQDDIHPVGTYFSSRKIGDEYIDWNWSSERIYNFIRAISDPGPCARVKIDNSEFKVKTARLIDNAPKYISHNGQIVGISNNEIIVKTGDTTIAINDMEEVTDNNLSFKIGDRFS